MKALAASALAALTSVAAGCATADPRQNVSSELETPRYTEAKREGAFELRRYQPYIAARTTVKPGEDNDAFRRLAGYIFGKNRSQQKIAMTAPVTTEASAAESEEIAMTAPVVTSEGDDGMTMEFMMPSEYTLDDLPVPEDPRVEFVRKPGRCQAAVVFSGFTTEGTLDEKKAELDRWIEEQGWAPVGAPVLARYNDPFTLPWNRRNELLVEVEGARCELPPTGQTAGR